ncbi:hypothetical protein GE09DRAFT_1024937 [Coniochaeta sp. 2T2.1]|nr:hypothetical protein GE09DRAFT_1024937 [Coniochaeta sp. 2T2.1]
MYWQTLVASSLLATGVQAGIGSLILDGMTRNSPSVERRMEEIAKASLRSRGYLEARQTIQEATTGPASNVLLNQDGTINMTAWDQQANDACSIALSHLPEASNPSGTCVCYNLPALDNVTGTFEADLRLYQLSAPSGQFSGIPPQNIQVGLSYKGASVVVSAAVAPRQDDPSSVNANLKLLQTYLFVGQIDRTQMTGPLTMAQLEALVMPVVTLTAVNTLGQTVSTNVSSNEAAFVAGVFSQSIIMSDFNQALLAVQEELAGLRNGTVAFVLPGVQIMVFPIGLVITSVWLAIGVAAYGMGTIQRIAFREQYQRAVQRESKRAVAYGRI